MVHVNFFSQIMDFLNIAINSKEVKDVCCLCYKKTDNTMGLNDDIEIHFENCKLLSTFGIILDNLFPSHELLLAQICEECSSLIIRIFRLFQYHSLKNDLVKHIVSNLTNQIDDYDSNMFLDKKCDLKINIVQDHSIVSYEYKDNNIKCNKCPMLFKSKVLLAKHVKVSHKYCNKSFICEICSKKFSKKFILEAHLKSHTKKECPYCFKSYLSESYYNLHVQNHSIPKPNRKESKYHKCAHCDYRTLNKSSLDSHKNKVHLHVKPYNCHLCQKSYYKKSHLNDHLLTHKKTKEKICDICGEMFLIERTLKEHLRLHSGDKPYLCDICNTGFITSGRRLEHVKRKHMEKEECCVVCDKKFSFKKDLHAHLKKVHSCPDMSLDGQCTIRSTLDTCKSSINSD